jgi:hypothetical protein
MFLGFIGFIMFFDFPSFLLAEKTDIREDR